MINKENYTAIGSVHRLHGYKGNLYFRSKFDLEYLFQEITPFFLFVELDTCLIPIRMIECSFAKKDLYLCHIADVESQEKASRFISATLLIETSLFAQYILENENTSIFVDQLLGFELIDDTQRSLTYGNVVAVDDSTQNILLIIEKNKKQFFLPAVSEFIKEIDYQKKMLFVVIPEGLIE